MADLILRDTDATELSRQIAAEVTAAVGAMLAENFEPQLVDRQRMAERAGIGIATLDLLVASGRIPSVTVGRRRLFLPADVIAALAANA